MVNKKTKWVICIVVACLFLMSVQFQLYTHDYTGLRERWVQCLDYIEEGTFWAGQPYCDGGPLPYYFAYWTRAIVGQDLLQPTILIQNLLLSLGTLYFLMRIYKEDKESNKEDTDDDNDDDNDNSYLFLLITLFGFIVYVNLLSEYETALITFFIFGAYYYLFYKKSEEKEMIAGLFFAGAMMSKFSAIIPLGIIGIMYLWKEGIIKKKEKNFTLSTNKDKYIKGFTILVPTIALYTFLKIKFEYFFIYLFLVQTKQHTALSLLETIKVVLLPSLQTNIVHTIPLYLLLGLCFYEFYKEIKENDLKSYTALAAIALPISIFLIVKSFGIGFITDFRYWAPLGPFVALTLMSCYKRLSYKAVGKAIVVTCFVLILLFPGAYYSPLTYPYHSANLIAKYHPYTEDRFEIMTTLNYVYSIIPNQEGKILVEWGQPHYIDEMYQQFSINVPKEKLFSITNSMAPTHPDVWQIPRFEELLGEDLIYDAMAEEGLTEIELELVNDINNGEFSLIVVGPPNTFVTSRILTKVVDDGNFCFVHFLSNYWLENKGLDVGFFILKDQEQCNELIKELYIYYNENFEKICSMNQPSAKIIKKIMERDNGVVFEKECLEGGTEGLSYMKNNSIIKKYQLLFMLIVATICLLLHVPPIRREKRKEEKREERKEGEKSSINMGRKGYYLLIGILIILILFLLMRIDYAIPYVVPIVV